MSEDERKEEILAFVEAAGKSDFVKDSIAQAKAIAESFLVHLPGPMALLGCHVRGTVPGGLVCMARRSRDCATSMARGPRKRHEATVRRLAVRFP